MSVTVQMFLHGGVCSQCSNHSQQAAGSAEMIFLSKHYAGKQFREMFATGLEGVSTTDVYKQE